jgi:hypothetical protein
VHVQFVNPGGPELELDDRQAHPGQFIAPHSYVVQPSPPGVVMLHVSPTLHARYAH